MNCASCISEIGNVLNKVKYTCFPTSLLLCEPCQHLIKYVVVFFIWEWPHHPRLIQEITVDLGPVEGSIRYLHLNEMTLKEKVCR